jgi:hypothetical protein
VSFSWCITSLVLLVPKRANCCWKTRFSCLRFSVCESRM